MHWCKAHGLDRPRGNLTLNDTTFPELSSTFKASCVKTLSRYVAAKGKALCTGSEKHKVRAVCLWAHWHFTWLLDGADLLLEEHIIEEAVFTGNLFLLSLSMVGIAC